MLPTMLPPVGSEAQSNAPSSVKSRERAHQAAERALEAAGSRSHSGRGRLPTLISLTALILSVVSLYETVLKQARPALHVGAVMYYTRDSESGESFAVPVTITNRGARDVVVTALDMQVATAKLSGKTRA